MWDTVPRWRFHPPPCIPSVKPAVNFTVLVTTCALQEDAKLHYGNPADFTLTVPQFSVKPGEVVAIIGRVGCGESRGHHTHCACMKQSCEAAQ